MGGRCVDSSRMSAAAKTSRPQSLLKAPLRTISAAGFVLRVHMSSAANDKRPPASGNPRHSGMSGSSMARGLGFCPRRSQSAGGRSSALSGVRVHRCAGVLTRKVSNVRLDFHATQSKWAEMGAPLDEFEDVGR